MEQLANNKLMVSVYQEFKYNLGERNLLEVLQEIKSDKYQSEINSIRYALHKGDEKTAEEIKSNLLGFTTSGTFGESRTKANITTYSQVICLDFDDIPVAEINNLITLINGCRYTFASFISPSNEGLKVFIKVNSNAEQHTTVYNQIANFYKELSGYDFDAKCKDITRLCFVSYDADLFLNEKAVIYEVKEEVKPLKTEPKREVKHNLTTDELLDKCLKFTEQKETYQVGSRNSFIHLFASNANRYGIHKEDTLDFCTTNFDLEEKEIKKTINSTYKNQSADFAKYANFANLQSSSEVKTNSKDITFEEYEDCLKTTPTIPQSVYDNLPPILFESCQVFKQERERDVFLTGALAILSGCLPNVSGLYSGSIIYPSLFSFILAPAASGKGALKFAKELADKYHDKTLALSLDDKKVYEENLSAYKMLKAKGKLEEGQAMPMAPKFKVVYIPANTSNAKIIQHLDCNEGKGIICETEADTLGQTFKNEWGSYSDMLRKSFHHEKISVSRKTDGEFVEVNNPQLSVALSGTPKQVFNIIASAEDGLFSRFIFYVFKTDAVWLDPSPKGNPINLTDYFKTQSNEVFKMVEYFERDELILQLTDEQWNKFNPTFSAYLQQINTFVSEDALSVVKRLGIILYRFCMLFTAIRKFKANDYHKEIFCSDIDFETALSLIKVYLQHSIIMFENLPKQGEQSVFKSGQNKKLFFEALPNNFQRKEAIEIAKSFNISERSVGTFLKSCLGKFLDQPEYGFYRKT
ncbi:DUF3987 domain-containing protein [Mariniflexile maritimum]|uniref:DUF3987 domain-containing protein n=1 Tax=Mariniflexile maritimum TaxID=2682493 RepID=UPI0012F663BB|nr:DUF3987 domain-containing protein [Mariniflexile maritimum]